ncbi:MAG: hypothetical protein RL369_1267, partial [Pseudomonadota bacterium]
TTDLLSPDLRRAAEYRRKVVPKKLLVYGGLIRKYRNVSIHWEIDAEGQTSMADMFVEAVSSNRFHSLGALTSV